MAEPCGFSFVNKDGETVNYKTIEDVLKAVYDGGFGDIVKLPEIKSVVQEPLKTEDVYSSVKSSVVEKEKSKGITYKDEVSELKNQAQDIFKAGLESINIAKSTSKAKLQAVSDFITSMSKDVDNKYRKGRITTKQASLITKRLGYLNLDNQKSVNSFKTYVENVIDNAEYKDKIDNVESTISSIKNKLKNKDIDSELRDLASKLVSMNPKNVSDIDLFYDTLDNVNKNIKGSSDARGVLKIASPINKSELSSFVKKEIDYSNSLRQKEIQDSFYEKTGLNPDEFSYEEMQDVLFSPKESKVDVNSPELGKRIDKIAYTVKSVFSDMIKKGKDSFTGDVFSYDKSIQPSITKMLNIDLNSLNNKEKLLMVDIMNDIMVNGNSNKIELFNIMSDVKRDAKAIETKYSAKKLRLFGFKTLGEIWNEQISSATMTSEALFKSIEKGEDFLYDIGFDAVRKGTVKATVDVNDFYKTIHDKYYSKQPNSGDFNLIKNDHERGLIAFIMMSRNQDEFNSNKSKIEQSIKNLSNSGDNELIKLGEKHKEVYDKILKDSKNLDDVISKSDKINVDTVKDFISKYESQYEDKQRVSKTIYNSELDKKENYTPITIKKIKGKQDVDADLDIFDSAILPSSQKVYDKKSGTFVESKKYDVLSPDKFISLDFLSDNEKKMKESLIDSYTAKDIQYLKTFLESDSMKRIIENKDDRDIFIDSIVNYVKIKRGRQMDTDTKTVKKIAKVMDSISRLGISRALGSISQGVTQTAPVMASTLVNTGSVGISKAMNPDWNELLNHSGYDIAVRGMESSSSYVDVEKILKQSKGGNLEKLSGLLSDAQSMYLKTFLAKPDVFVARASWIAYYLKNLESQGESIDFDPKTHVINDKAARYAQSQVDRQQNTSDPALEGRLLSSNKSSTKIVRGLVMPLAKFSLNQKARMYNDFRSLGSFSSSWEDKKKSILSILGLAVEMGVFMSIKEMIDSFTQEKVQDAMGYEEDEREKKKSDDRKINNRIMSVASNVVSPFPYFDYASQKLVEKIIEDSQKVADVPKEDRLNLTTYGDGGLSKFGAAGITFDGVGEIIDFSLLIREGKFKDKKGKEMQVSPEDLTVLRSLSTPFYAQQLGIMPRETLKIVNSAVNVAKKRATPVGEDVSKSKIYLR